MFLINWPAVFRTLFVDWWRRLDDRSIPQHLRDLQRQDLKDRW